MSVWLATTPFEWNPGSSSGSSTGLLMQRSRVRFQEAENLSIRKRGSIVYSLSLSPSHRPDMTVEKDVKLQKKVHPSIHLNCAGSCFTVKFIKTGTPVLVLKNRVLKFYNAVPNDVDGMAGSVF